MKGSNKQHFKVKNRREEVSVSVQFSVNWWFIDILLYEFGTNQGAHRH